MGLKKLVPLIVTDKKEVFIQKNTCDFFHRQNKTLTIFNKRSITFSLWLLSVFFFVLFFCFIGETLITGLARLSEAPPHPNPTPLQQQLSLAPPVGVKPLICPYGESGAVQPQLAPWDETAHRLANEPT